MGQDDINMVTEPAICEPLDGPDFHRPARMRRWPTARLVGVKAGVEMLLQLHHSGVDDAIRWLPMRDLRSNAPSQQHK